MATDPFKAFFDKLEDIENELDKVVPDLGEQLAQDIKKRTRAGYGSLGDKYRLPPLSDSYKRQRRSMGRRGRLSPDTSPTTSNLTQTGAMLNSLEFVRIGKHQGKVVPTGTDANGMSNEEKADLVSAQGRPFLFATKGEEKRLVETLKKKLKDIIRKLK